MGQDPDTGAHKSLYGALGQARINGGGYPAQIWAQYTKSALKNSGAKDFDLQLQPGAEEQQLPSTQPTDEFPGTVGQDDGDQSTGGESAQSPPADQTEGQTQGQTDGQTTDGTTTTGGTTDGTTTGGTTDAGTTTGGTTDAGTTTGTGGTTDAGTTTDGTTDGGTTGTTAGAGPLSGLTSRKQ